MLDQGRTAGGRTQVIRSVIYTVVCIVRVRGIHPSTERRWIDHRRWWAWGGLGVAIRTVTHRLAD
jgi:hypothetical protein